MGRLALIISTMLFVASAVETIKVKCTGIEAADGPYNYLPGACGHFGDLIAKKFLVYKADRSDYCIYVRRLRLGHPCEVWYLDNPKGETIHFCKIPLLKSKRKSNSYSLNFHDGCVNDNSLLRDFQKVPGLPVTPAELL